MWAYVICGFIWIGFISLWSFSSIPKGRTFEIYAGCGIGICLSLLIFRLSGQFQTQSGVTISKIISVAGNVFYVSAIIVVIVSLTTLKFKGKPKGWVEYTTHFVNEGIFRIVRHPLYLGCVLWSIGLMFLIQSIPSTTFGALALFCFWMASKKEDAFNISRFGDVYREYTERVPMWNVIKGFMDLRRTSSDEKHL